MYWGTWLVLLGNKAWPCFVQLGVNCKSQQRPKIVRIVLCCEFCSPVDCCVFCSPVDKKFFSSGGGGQCLHPDTAAWCHLSDGLFSRTEDLIKSQHARVNIVDRKDIKSGSRYFSFTRPNFFFASCWRPGNCASWIQNYAKHICCLGHKSDVFQIKNW